MQMMSRRTAGHLLMLAVTSMISRRAFAGDGETPSGPSVLLAINGYDPVAYFVAGRPMLGLSQFEMEYNDRIYRFASAENLARFKTDPEHYAPQYRGQCALDLTEGKVSSVIPDAWLIRDGKLYLFGAPQGPSVFQNNYADNVKKANQNSSRVPAQ